MGQDGEGRGFSADNSAAGSQPPRVPTSTYRLQLNKDFPLAAAQDALPYLSELGISDVYASPILEARAGSVHGYDVVNHDHINAELGGDEAFDKFGRAAKEAHLGIVLDVVPNHMCVEGNANQWWTDVLEHGRSSLYANHFDIDWRPPKPDLAERVLLPVLGDQYGRILENDLSIKLVNGAFRAALPYAWFPLAPRSCIHILDIALEKLRERLPPDSEPVMELESIITGLRHLPLRTETDPARVRERRREAHIIEQRVVQLQTNADAAAAIEAALRVTNGTKGDRSSFDLMEKILAEQAYRLSFWRVAADEINYRRFFDINELAAIRVELPEVFEAVHRLTLKHAASGFLTGLRIDHVDGLYDPEKYLVDLQAAWKAATGQPGYILVEKILGPGETLPETWPVAGTTGYDYLNTALALAIDAEGARPLKAFAAARAEGPPNYGAVVLQSKQLVLEASMASELTVLARRLDRISEQHRYTRDFTLNNLRNGLAAVIAGFQVYRSYVRRGDETPSARDEAAVQRAVKFARRHNPAMNAAVFDFIRDVLLLRDPDGLSEAQISDRREFVLKLQQVTGPIMAKGLEDTTFYRYYPLAALNEVGGEPDHFGITLEAFHEAQRQRLLQTPHALSATATHDTKRGEDTRLRIAVLSEIPGAWRKSVERWFVMNERLATQLPDGRGPSRYEEYLIYQTLLGTWPIGGLPAAPDYVERILAYIEKALKEAKQNTSWISPNEPHDQAVKQFITKLLDPAESPAFIEDFDRFSRKPQWAAYWSSLAQVVLKATCPGVPDVYQGTEMWDLSLVDPDNRRAVDYGFRRRALADMQRDFAKDPQALLGRLVARPHDGRIKLWVAHRSLAHRRDRPELYQKGDYVPLEVSGDRWQQVVAFARVHDGKAVISVTGRFFTRFGPQLRRPVAEQWETTTIKLPPELQGLAATDVLTAASVDTSAGLSVARVLERLPVAVLQLG